MIAAAAAAVIGCAGPAGPEGKQGEPGMPGMGTPSVSAVMPAYAYLGRKVDLSIAGSQTSWSSATTVAFSDPDVKVTKVTAASPTGLVVHVTVGAGATAGTTDVTVTDGSTQETYKGAFEIRTPLAVALDQPGGVPQGGFADVHAEMLDFTTPFDAATLSATLGVQDVTLASTPAASGDYAVDFIVAADVLATAGESVDMVVSSGVPAAVVTSPAKAAFQVAARAPSPIVSGMGASGTITTITDSSLYAFTAATASQRFVQYNVSSAEMGGVEGILVPKSGRFVDAIGAFAVRFGMSVTSTDPTYAVVTDGGGGNPVATPPPYSFDFNVVETPCTAFTNPGKPTTKLTPIALTGPAVMVQGDLGDGTTGTGDWYSIVVQANMTLHAASGGDALSAVSLVLQDSSGTQSSKDAGDDYHKDVTLVAGATGVYLVQVTPDAAVYDPMHSKYIVLIEVK